ncbi:MAG: alanine racemase, partial [Alistipes sp.]|nr:alanine racemase [Alistipes sp.]
EKLLIAEDAKTIIYHGDYTELAESIRQRYADRELIDARGCEIEEQRDMASQRNAACTVAFFRAMGYEEPDLSRLQQVSMRLELKEGIANSLIIDDSYNSDINSLSIALDYARSLCGERRLVLILSDILQSGFDEDELYNRVATLVRGAGVDMFVGVGEHLLSHRHKFAAGSQFYANTDMLLSQVDMLNITDSVVLIKGNRMAMVERISHRLERRSHTTVLEVNLQAMARNINYFRSFMAPKTRLIAMVKAASYGAGDVEVAQMLQKQGVAYLAVAFTDEGVTLRRKGITMPILVLNADDASFYAMIDAALEPEIYSLRSLRTFVDVARRHGVSHYPIHLKLDTGMHRLGFEQDDIEELLATLDAAEDVVKVASLFTHLATSDMTDSDDFTLQQIATFEQLSSCITKHLPYRVMRHAAASAAIVRFPQAHYDACRLGLGLYGFGFEHNPALEMVSTLRSRIVQIRRVAATDTIGYGRAGQLSRDSVIATVPIGYADGLNRLLGEGRWSMLVNGKAAPIVGRICMDSCMIDITDIDGVSEGDEVVVFSPIEGNTPEDMARCLGTIPYEILTSVDKRVKRIYVNE